MDKIYGSAGGQIMVLEVNLFGWRPLLEEGEPRLSERI